LQCNCANKNALLPCEIDQLTATKINPGQLKLPGLYRLLPQLEGSFDPGGGGDVGVGGCRPGRAYDLSTPIGCSRLRGNSVIIW
jgi:hypothetical protein